ncbi:hypothetical protein B0H63DRAFT_517637 [Podospora didyma]|uniref:Uncharacterized protein n=1 Tax=Podospora didyma TaxID=330526 RepID=A0AAE0P719_9PEZI|nr:hypothetical protein B0H63DRAFT_517637 [Podospora didyma]
MAKNESSGRRAVNFTAAPPGSSVNLLFPTITLKTVQGSFSKIKNPFLVLDQTSAEEKPNSTSANSSPSLSSLNSASVVESKTPTSSNRQKKSAQLHISKTKSKALTFRHRQHLKKFIRHQVLRERQIARRTKALSKLEKLYRCNSASDRAFDSYSARRLLWKLKRSSLLSIDLSELSSVAGGDESIEYETAQNVIPATTGEGNTSRSGSEPLESEVVLSSTQSSTQSSADETSKSDHSEDSAESISTNVTTPEPESTQFQTKMAGFSTKMQLKQSRKTDSTAKSPIADSKADGAKEVHVAAESSAAKIKSSAFEDAAADSLFTKKRIKIKAKTNELAAKDADAEKSTTTLKVVGAADEATGAVVANELGLTTETKSKKRKLNGKDAQDRGEKGSSEPNRKKSKAEKAKAEAEKAKSESKKRKLDGKAAQDCGEEGSTEPSLKKAKAEKAKVEMTGSEGKSLATPASNVTQKEYFEQRAYEMNSNPLGFDDGVRDDPRPGMREKIMKRFRKFRNRQPSPPPLVMSGALSVDTTAAKSNNRPGPDRLSKKLLKKLHKEGVAQRVETMKTAGKNHGNVMGESSASARSPPQKYSARSQKFNKSHCSEAPTMSGAIDIGNATAPARSSPRSGDHFNLKSGQTYSPKSQKLTSSPPVPVMIGAISTANANMTIKAAPSARSQGELFSQKFGRKYSPKAQKLDSGSQVPMMSGAMTTTNATSSPQSPPKSDGQFRQEFGRKHLATSQKFSKSSSSQVPMMSGTISAANSHKKRED